MTILTVPIADAKVPQIFNFGKVLYHKEVVLVSLCDTVACFTWARQVSKLSNLIVYLAQRLRLWWWLLRWLLFILGL